MVVPSHHSSARVTSSRNTAAAAKGKNSAALLTSTNDGKPYWEDESDDIWEWTLNWNRIRPKLLVGTCPCTPEDVDRLVNEAGVEAFVCMQTDKEMEALDIDYPEIYQHMLDVGAVPTRIAIEPNNEYHQAKEIPEVVRIAMAHMNAGRKTYIYGTAGTNRAAYALVLMFCFFEKMEMEDAIKEAGKLRPQAKTNTDLWLEVHGVMMTEETRGKNLMINYRAMCYPWGRNGSMTLWFKEFTRVVEDHKKYYGREHPLARELERLR